MSLNLYTISGAPRGWRVLVGLTLKKLDWQTHILEASKGDHKTPEFLQLNPRGTVPVLKADELTLTDSLAILAWLDREYPANPLFGKTANEAALIWQVSMECCDYLRSVVQELLHPILVLGEELPNENSAKMAFYDRAVEKMHSELQSLEKLLAQSSFLVGDQPSAAEAVAFPEISIIQRATETKHSIMDALGLADIRDHYPNIAKWKCLVESLPGMDKTSPPHWSE